MNLIFIMVPIFFLAGSSTVSFWTGCWTVIGPDPSRPLHDLHLEIFYIIFGEKVKLGGTLGIPIGAYGSFTDKCGTVWIHFLISTGSPERFL